MAMSGLTRIAEYIPATEVTVARTWDAMSLTSLGYTENITGKQPLRTLDGIHMDTIQNKTNMMYIAMTFEEFTSWTQNGELKHIHGWARSPEVEYIVLNSSPFEVVTTILNYISVGTCRTQHLDTFIVATVQLDARHIAEWASRGYINFFNRGYSAAHMQIHMNKTWMQTQDELSKHQVFKYTGKNGLLGIYMKFNWKTGYIWSHNACVNLEQLATDEDTCRRHATVAQALSLMGVGSIKHLPPAHQVTLVRHISVQDANSLNTRGTIEGQAVPGHPGHMDYILEQQHLFYMNYAATKAQVYNEYITGVKQGSTLLTQ